MGRMPHLRDQDEEHEVARERKHGIRDRDEGGGEIGRDHDAPIRDAEIGPRADHPHDSRNQDRDHARHAQPAQLIQRAREREEQSRDGEDARVEHEAELAVRERRERDLSGQDLPARGEDGEDDGPEREDLPSQGTEKNHPCVAHVVDYQRKLVNGLITPSDMAAKKNTHGVGLGWDPHLPDVAT